MFGNKSVEFNGPGLVASTPKSALNTVLGDNKVIKEESFRSQPTVNTSDDMLRVTIYIKRRNKYRLRDFIDKLNA